MNGVPNFHHCYTFVLVLVLLFPPQYYCVSFSYLRTRFLQAPVKFWMVYRHLVQGNL
ncbi:unnamed protein product [Brassica oleracea var. botrytis]|uniref:(rape) hypothetical protein n=1 Tax=Brassica napus TaxID=3708 RepID=A0A078F9B7_BRANA|nr:unnamed protein product [Brassica napus]CDY09584.1 BnaC05g23350D [Brassica napus]